MSREPRASDAPDQHHVYQSLLSGNRNDLARAITIVENNLDGRNDIYRAIESHLGNAHVVGFTGAPGVGKSTLIDACIKEFREIGRTVAVLAIDPSSHLGGGAILGDRVRMAQHTGDDGVFIRSVASRGHLGGLSSTAMNIVNLFDACGWNTVIVETVGAGQSEIEISSLADTVVVVESPAMGDDIQAIKSGILEIADVVVINKSDLAESELATSHLTQSIALRPSSKQPRVLNTTATTGDGVFELVQEITDLKSISKNDCTDAVTSTRLRRIVSKIICQQIEKNLTESEDKRIDEFINRVNSGDIDLNRLADAITRQFMDSVGNSGKTDC